MLVKLQNYDSQVTLIEGTGIQFLDFGFCKSKKDLVEGNFIENLNHSDNPEYPPVLLLQDNQGNLIYPDVKKEKYIGKPKYFCAGIDSIKAFNSVWLPFPYFQYKTDGNFLNGPSNWARIRIVELFEPDDDGNFFRATIAFDTNLNSGKL